MGEVASSIQTSLERMDGTTFAVDKVKRALGSLNETDVSSAVYEALQIQGEASFYTPRCLVDTYCFKNNKFLSAVHTAYDDHYPLILTPDIIWTVIVQGFAQHMRLNAEVLRCHLDIRKPKIKVLTVRRDDFIKDTPSNPWPEMFDSFSEQITNCFGQKIHTLLTPEFTTTSPLERIAAKLVVMDTFKDYFEYDCSTNCRIPEITLEGTIEDWTALKQKAMALASFELSWWTDELCGVLDNFVAAASGKANKTFWSSLYKTPDTTASPLVTGWVLSLFPYVSGQRNQYLSLWRDKERSLSNGLMSSRLPAGVSSTPLVWKCLDTEYAMRLYAGFMAVSQDPKTLGLRPEIGWAVAEDSYR